MRHPSHKPYIIFVVFVALVLAVVLFVMSAKKKSQKSALATSPAAAQELAKSAPDQNLQKFSLTGFDEQGKKFWNLEGDNAKIDAGQTITLDQNVTLKLRDDTVVKTSRLQWSQDGGLMRTSAPVLVTRQNTQIKGTGAIGRPGDSFIQLNRDIDMIVNETTHLRCKGPMKIFYKENKMIFYRDVQVTDQKGTLKSRRMDVFFDPTEKKVNEIVAVGDVVIERGSDTTRSQRAIYTVASGAVRLEGNPEIILHKESTKLLDGTLRN